METRSLLSPRLMAVLVACSAAVRFSREVQAMEQPDFARQNLVAWCIVPFDAKRRGPEERAKMLQRLGFTKLAYDWRDEHVPTFEDEIAQLKAHGIEFFAFWGVHDKAFDLFAQHKMSPQIWQTLGSPPGATQEEKVEQAAKGLLPLVERTRKMGSKLGLYNHGGWGGEPESLAAVCEWLRKNAQAEHVGKGQHDKAMLDAIRASGYAGPIGLIGHRAEVDAEQSLGENLEGLKQLLGQIGDAAALKTYR